MQIKLLAFAQARDQLGFDEREVFIADREGLEYLAETNEMPERIR